MARFEINGKEYELKITYGAATYLDKQAEGGQMEVVGRALMGDFSLFPHIIHAALFHTGEGFTLDNVNKAIEDAVDSGELDATGIIKLSNEVIGESFFYKRLVANLSKASGKEGELQTLVSQLTE